MKRPVFEFGGGPAHDHKGFNWRVLHERLKQQLDVTRVVASPFSWLGPGLATQVWFIARLRDAAGEISSSRHFGAASPKP